MWSFIQGVFSIDASTFGSRMQSNDAPVFDCWKRIATCVSALQAEIICLDDPLKRGDRDPQYQLVAIAPPMAYALQWY